MTTTHVLLALVVVLVVSRAVAWVFARFGQPAVVGETVAGLLIGPSVLGRFAPGVAKVLLPPDSLVPLGVLAQVGIVIFMFLVGLELDPALIARRTKESVFISNASVALPFGLGLLLAVWLRPRFAAPGVPGSVFALFIAVSMSVTAFPVLARILQDRRMQRSPLGVLALACAAFNDVTAWCLLAVVVSVARWHAASAGWTVALVTLFAAAMFFVVRPVAGKRLARLSPSPNALALVLAGLLASALVTDAIGVHALFGAFLFGVIIPHDSPLARALGDKLTDFVVVLLLPAFFAYTGMRTRLDTVHGAAAWGACALITVVATAGKLGGTFAAAKLVKLPSGEAFALGALMNTRGLMELVVLNLGLDLGVVPEELFAMLVVMAVATTLATTPLLQLLEALDRTERTLVPTERARDPTE